MLPSLDSFSFLVLLSINAIGVYAGPTSMRKTGGSSKSQTSRFDAKNLLGYAYWSPNTGMVGDSPQVDIFPSYGTVPQYREVCQKCLVFDDHGWFAQQRSVLSVPENDPRHSTITALINQCGGHHPGTDVTFYQSLMADGNGQTQKTSVMLIPRVLWHQASLRIECPEPGQPGHDYEKPVNWKKLKIIGWDVK
ncbi:hypothetical protein C8R41DRAFT_108547 [Lentinula lateritia]|uniref:Uncharacterized protein n=1 Tax=Lentinula lateritia TaxID=40482 RepID=A0ABQ8VRH4_9AGAR|nr:hypothetical protein C8R41DRAFT_108547 [Lentinula lateritia]